MPLPFFYIPDLGPLLTMAHVMVATLSRFLDFFLSVLFCLKTWKEEEGSFSGNPTSSVMGMRNQVRVGVSEFLGYVGGLLTAVSQVSWTQMKQNGGKNCSSHCLLYLQLYPNQKKENGQPMFSSSLASCSSPCLYLILQNTYMYACVCVL